MQGEIRQWCEETSGRQRHTPRTLTRRNGRPFHVSERPGVQTTGTGQTGCDEPVVAIPKPLLHIPAERALFPSGHSRNDSWFYEQNSGGSCSRDCIQCSQDIRSLPLRPPSFCVFLFVFGAEQNGPSVCLGLTQNTLIVNVHLSLQGFASDFPAAKLFFLFDCLCIKSA